MSFLRWLIRLVHCDHEDIFCYEPGRLSVRCLKCGRQTKGIAIG